MLLYPNIILFITEPGAPRNVRATVTSPTEVKLVWDAPIQSSAGVTGYEIYQVHFMTIIYYA